MTLPLPRVVVLAPSRRAEPGMVIAASRAGALGALDFGFANAVESAHGAAQAVATFLKGRSFGLRLSARALLAGGAATHWPAPDPAVVVIVTDDSDGGWDAVIACARQIGGTVVAEVTSRESARRAVSAGCDAIIVAGNEAGGRGADESSLILLQAVVAETEVPVWVRGGIGPFSAAACVAAGAAGVVLDGAVLLARESPLAPTVRERLERWDGSETIVVGKGTRNALRVHVPVGSSVRAALEGTKGTPDDSLVGWGVDQAWPVGQDAALAAALARRFVTVGGIVQEVERAIDEGLAMAGASRPLAEDSPLARSHGTRYPVVQGPMTRVSDSVAFAAAVAEGGALPFLALALMRGEESSALLAQAEARLAGSAWGVGILGFVPPELRIEQVEAIRRFRPPFALIAGGRPDQANELESEGIATYLHVPSPGLLRRFWEDGARRIILEGRECGGHVGPRSSLVLWEQAVRVLLEIAERGESLADLHLLFAGGIHDGRSAAAVSALAAPLAAREAKVGVLIGTAYLFTSEAVATGAVVPGFQSEALKCERTVLLETGPGHEVRVSPTPFVDQFEEERHRLIGERRPAEEVRTLLEGMNAGRLRIASKGIERRNGAGSPLITVANDDQRTRGLYMLGQAALLRDRVTTIAELHREICDGAAEHVEKRLGGLDQESAPTETKPSDIAIVGMSSIVPGAADVRTFWENTLRGVDAITEVPADRWDWRLYYDADPKAPDKITSKWGGFIPDIPFDPLRYGMPPTSLPSIEPLHLLTLEVVRAALDDAGYRDRPFPRERTAVVLGAGGGAAQLAMGYAFRSYLPLLDTVLPDGGREALESCGPRLPEWTEDSFPGILLNVAAGRVANRFDLGGANYTVDAACGSSLAAASLAVRELETGAADMVILGGADTVQNPFTYLAFSKTQAFSARGRCRPFDAGADGIVISEAAAVLVLKRLADAERDGDRIYAVIKGLGASSDGRAKGLTAPRPEGQMRALRRAYEKSGVSPVTVGYVEAHGTGTAAGDLSEVRALSEVFAESGASPGECALGSVKSSIGHTKCAAGLAGLINAALALHHRVLPPTIGVETPNPRAGIEASPFHVSTRTRPWLHSDDERPRRAGVSAFGFGGTNFHAVLEAYEDAPRDAAGVARDWPAELLVWRAGDRAGIAGAVDRLASALEAGAAPLLRDLAATLAGALGTGKASLAIVATSIEDLRTKLSRVRGVLGGDAREFHDPSGIDFSERGADAESRLAFLFPGQGAQRVEMLLDLAVTFDEVRGGFEAVDSALRRKGRRTIGSLVFPAPAFGEEQRQQQAVALRAPECAQPALGAASVGLLRLLESLGLAPDMVAGHSYGELVALHAAGVYSVDALAELSEGRGRFLAAVADGTPSAMAALATGPEQIGLILDGIAGVGAVNFNGPSQTVISGSTAAVDRAMARAREKGVRGQVLPVPVAFHSRLVAAASAPLAELAAKLDLHSPRLPVYSNVHAAPISADPSAIPSGLGEHLASPVRFAEMIEAMYKDGARLFVEVGPGSTLTGLVGSILGKRPHLAVACQPTGRDGITGLLLALSKLFAAGYTPDLGRLTSGRDARRVDATRFTSEARTEPIGPATWLVNGSRARPAHAPEPPRLGPGPALPVSVPKPARIVEVPVSSAASRSPERNGTAHAPRARPQMVAPPASTLDPGADRVLEAFQKTMQTFLEVQRDTMLAFLGGQARPGTIEVPQSSARMVPEIAPLIAAPVPVQAVVVEPKAEPAKVDAPTPNGKVLGPADLERHLLEIVRERTGYPAEMLRLDLDIEADLGIDSIKRVEILGNLRDLLPRDAIKSDTELMDQLSRARTLRAIVDRVAAALKGGARGTNGAPAKNGVNGSHTPHTNGNGNGASTNGTHATDGSAPAATNGHSGRNGHSARPGVDSIRRRVLEVLDAPPSESDEPAGLRPGGLLLITDDGRGTAAALSTAFRAEGHPVVTVSHDLARDGYWDHDEAWADLGSPASVTRLFDRLRERGPIAGIVHALPLRELPAANLDAAAWAARMAPEVRGLFLLARAGAEDLARSAARGGACLVACTSLGGTFASVGTTEFQGFPGQGAIAGMVKTLAREWPRAVRVRVVDFDPRLDANTVAKRVLRETTLDDRHPEVGYRGDRRIVLRATGSELRRGGAPEMVLEAGAPILITGGARGITATVAADLAKRWRSTLLLMGTSPEPPDREDPATAGVVTASDLKAILHRRLSRDGSVIRPATLEQAYQSLRREREIRTNLGALRSLGVTVEYAQADVLDTGALGVTLARWRKQYGPVAGLIHAAGVIQDKLLRDKTPESFDHVLGTKLGGALNLVRMLDAEPPKFAAFFSSVAGRFGNRGQADYAAANDALNKLAIWLDRRWSGRVVSIIWGPWSTIGMVAELESHLGQRGLEMIAPERGARLLGDELESGRKGDVEVVLAGELGSLGEPEAVAAPAVRAQRPSPDEALRP